jgi:hypothetical protein
MAIFRLTSAALKRKRVGHFRDGLGLWLQVSHAKGGGFNRSWVFRYTAESYGRKLVTA